jgi:hypothetical protein
MCHDHVPVILKFDIVDKVFAIFDRMHKNLHAVSAGNRSAAVKGIAAL